MPLGLKNGSVHSYTQVSVKCILNLKEKARFLKKNVFFLIQQNKYWCGAEVPGATHWTRTRLWPPG